MDSTNLLIWRLTARVLRAVALLLTSLAIIGLGWHSQLSDSARLSMALFAFIASALLVLSPALPLVPRFITVLQEKSKHPTR